MRLLPVEDERRLAQSLRRGFEEEGHVVDLANDGEEAVDLGTMNEYDVIVLDIGFAQEERPGRLPRAAGGPRHDTALDADRTR